MKKSIIMLMLIVLTSCEKEPDYDNRICATCTLVTITNSKEADYKCKGLANNYPKLDELITTIPAERICGKALLDYKGEIIKNETTINNSCGLVVTFRSVLRCAK